MILQYYLYRAKVHINKYIHIKYLVFWVLIKLRYTGDHAAYIVAVASSINYKRYKNSY